MQTLLVIALVLAMLATLGALIRGIVVFLRTKEAELIGGVGPSVSGMQQNRAMRARIFFQFIAVALAMMLLYFARHA